MWTRVIREEMQTDHAPNVYHYTIRNFYCNQYFGSVHVSLNYFTGYAHDWGA